jgi:hypothetical protein
MHVCDDINECEEKDEEESNPVCAAGEACHNTIGQLEKGGTLSLISFSFSCKREGAFLARFYRGFCVKRQQILSRKRERGTMNQIA